MHIVANRLVCGLILACSGISIAQAAPVEFKVMADWGTGYNAQLKLTNETSEPMTDWRIAFDYEGDIKQVYSGKLITGQNGHYIIEGSSWNKTIKPGKTVILGWNGKKAGDKRQLDNVDFTATDISVPAGPYAIGYDLQADWGTGYVASMSVANNGDTDINDWTLSFDYPYPIGHIYNADIISHSGNRYTIKGVDEGRDLVPQEVSVFVLRGNVGGLTAQPSNIVFEY